MQTEHAAPFCARSLFRGGAAAAVLLVAMVMACAKPPPDTDAARGQAVERRLGESVVGDLSCADGDCADWNRVRLSEAGNLRVGARVVRSDTPNAVVHVTLENGRGDLIAVLENVGNDGQGIRRRLEKGVYLVEIRSNLNTKTIIYDFETRFDPIRSARTSPPKRTAPVAPPSPPEPVYRRESADVLKVEGRLAEPTAVFLDVGTSDGITLGQPGELVESDGTVVGTFRVSEIYDDGSRAAVDLPLRRAVTPSVGAVLLFEVDPDGAPSTGGAPRSPATTSMSSDSARDDATPEATSMPEPVAPSAGESDRPAMRDRDRSAPAPRVDPDDPWAM